MGSKKNTVKTELNLTRGRRLGKYRLENQLGIGGSSEVWKARDCVEGMYVALKIPMMDVRGQRDNQALFREIRLVSKLRHRHIMPVKNADIIEDHLVVATELSFKTLDDCSRPMSLRRILSIIAQVLDGLAYAHRHRLVHCDVTPGNIFLFPKGRSALGDFGISQQIKGRMKTIDEFGTPGYVAPEQAYGRPTFRSDCFAIGLILYEYITGVLPRWPFRWPGKGYKRLRERTNLAFIRFLKQALSVDPARRFADAGQMLAAFLDAIPKKLRPGLPPLTENKKLPNWRQVRREDFIKRYKKVFTTLYRCVECAEPVAESMKICPWCGTGRNRFDTRSRLDYICPRCHRGILPEWRFCPWCYGSGFEAPTPKRSTGVRYHGKCRYCKGGLLRFMQYCPWCRRKVRKPWQVRPFPEVCNRCKWPVDTSFWNYCPWCGQILIG